MKKHLSLLSTAVMLALSTSASAVVITDSEGDQKVTGDQEYSQVFAIKGGTLTFTEANLLTVDNRTHQLQNSPAFIAQNGGTINFGTEESKLGTISVKWHFRMPQRDFALLKCHFAGVNTCFTRGNLTDSLPLFLTYMRKKMPIMCYVT